MLTVRRRRARAIDAASSLAKVAAPSSLDARRHSSELLNHHLETLTGLTGTQSVDHSTLPPTQVQPPEQHWPVSQLQRPGVLSQIFADDSHSRNNNRYAFLNRSADQVSKSLNEQLERCPSGTKPHVIGANVHYCQIRTIMYDCLIERRLIHAVSVPPL
eukprot:CAMPEP_0114539404 /NCGR_PEP_ID=MMETSP0114-20121206/219_1 /TAXON_ID=31324 /ORGANISM="Goniomonas sp, Strain m" /LENGTH=158 /DNA_ID=CAMNT_0001723503 /DNA_START=1015 /DNA_END=1493 /DNA_ORIENTATION=-